MNRPFSIGVVILACLCSVVGKSYAWNQPPVAVITGDDPRYVRVGEVVDFYGQNSYDQDEGGWHIDAWYWLHGRFCVIISGQTSIHMTCYFDRVGTDSVALKVQDDEDTWSEYASCTVHIVKPQMKLEKVGNTTIEPGNDYSENTTIRVTAVNPAGQTCEYFTGTVNIGEDTSDPAYEEIYSQNGGYLPSNITFTEADNGVKTFVAKSLAGPRVERSEPPEAANIITTNYDVYDADYLAVQQWTNDLGRFHLEKTLAGSVVYDWFEKRMKDMFDDASGDADTVLDTVDYYNQNCSSEFKAQIIDWDHESPTAIKFNPYIVEVRLNDVPDQGWTCGEDRGPDHAHTLLHEARHCYQEYLSSVHLGQTDDDSNPNTPNNDDDQDWLVDSVDDIDPPNYILDTTGSRPTCAGNESFSGDADPDSYEDAIERDAEGFAVRYYENLPLP